MTNDDLLLFDVDGPRVIPVEQGQRGGRYVSPEQGLEFFLQNDDIAEERGCYVFCMRSGGGCTPWYVGKATKGFESECFQSHKLVKYNQGITKSGAGTPVLFFLKYPRTKGPPSKWAIDELETYLIQTAFNRNPDLLNMTKRGYDYWGIRGFPRSGKGKPSDAARLLRDALWL